MLFSEHGILLNLDLYRICMALQVALVLEEWFSKIKDDNTGFGSDKVRLL